MPRKILAPEVRCQEQVSGSGPWGAFHSHQCENQATITRDGHRYCNIHDPEYIQVKRAGKQAQWDRESAERQARFALDKARGIATEGLTLEELKQVSPNLIRERILTCDVNKLDKEV